MINVVITGITTIIIIIIIIIIALMNHRMLLKTEHVSDETSSMDHQLYNEK